MIQKHVQKRSRTFRHELVVSNVHIAPCRLSTEKTDTFNRDFELNQLTKKRIAPLFNHRNQFLSRFPELKSVGFVYFYVHMYHTVRVSIEVFHQCLQTIQYAHDQTHNQSVLVILCRLYHGSHSLNNSDHQTSQSN